jgi:hypothetical protein
MKNTPWATKVAVGTLITALVGGGVTGAFAWVTRTSARGHDHETRITVLEDHTKTIDKNIDEVKKSQERIEDKLDAALRRR